MAAHPKRPRPRPILSMGGTWMAAAGASLSAALALAGCHLALGLETAETIDATALCETDAECDDGNPCTADACSGTCENTPLSGVDAPDEQQTAGDCARISCVSGTATSLPDDADLPDDDQECTADSCSDGSPVHDPVQSGTPCTQDGGQVCSGGACVQCHSNADCTLPETCGGGGTPNECGCTPTQSCALEGLTCGFISDMTCGGSINCNNNMQDGGETDIDCGGDVSSCSLRCQNGQSCMQPSDCASNNCVNNVCEA